MSGFGQTDPVRKQAGVQQSSGPLLASASQPIRTGSDPACLWNAKYSQNVTYICKNVLSVNHVLLECPITTELFQKNGYDVNARDTLYNTDVLTSIVKLIVHSPVGQ